MTITTRAIVGPDGIVHLEVPIGEEHAGEEVELTVQAPITPHIAADGPAHPENRIEYLMILDRLHGCIDDPTFEYPETGVYRAIPRW